ncbi:MAG: hypothetical protein WC307_07025 [Candidatus Nanoarchaeia archaeon]|jgi:hypothetical protein
MSNIKPRELTDEDKLFMESNVKIIEYEKRKAKHERDKEIALKLNKLFNSSPYSRQQLQTAQVIMMKCMGYDIRDWLLLFGPFREADEDWIKMVNEEKELGRE